MPTCFKYRLDHLPLYEFLFAIYCLIVYFYEVRYLCCNACAFLKVAFLNIAFSEFLIHKSNKWVKYLGAIDSIVNGQVKIKNNICFLFFGCLKSVATFTRFDFTQLKFKCFNRASHSEFTNYQSSISNISTIDFSINLFLWKNNKK